MAQVPWKQLMPEQPELYKMPFWYNSLQSFWLYYPARRDLVEALLPELPPRHGVRLAEFDDLPDRALVSLDFQACTSGGANFLGFTHEVEFNVYVYPESRLPSVPLMSVREYLLGRDQTKTIGGFRRTRYRGLERTGLAGYLVATAYNLVRLAHLPRLKAAE